MQRISVGSTAIVYEKDNSVKEAAKIAFPYTIPMMAGFIFLGIAYGIYMQSYGFSAIYPILMAISIFAGSMEFVTVGLLLTSFNPLNALFLTLMVNGRHIFYGISMLDKYKNTGNLAFPANKPTPEYIKYLAKVLPSAIFGMLVIYCYKNVNLLSENHGIPELLAGAVVVGLQFWKRNMFLSIAAGTILYMVLIQVVF